MLYRIFSLLLITLLAMLCGCSDNGKISDPPAARAELTARLYDALQDKRYEDALAITDKLKALDPNDADLIEMHNRIVGNICVSAIQNSVDAGQLNNALEVIKKYRHTRFLLISHVLTAVQIALKPARIPTDCQTRR